MYEPNVSYAAYAQVVSVKDRIAEDERVWCEFVRMMRLEDGLRWVLDNELELHDAVESGQMSLRDVGTAAKDRFVTLR